METFELPDPLPERLPGESHNAYRLRVIPGFPEWKRLHRPWRRYVSRVVRDYRRDNGPVPEDDIGPVLDAAWEEWHAKRPEDAERLSELGQRMPWVEFDD